MYNIQPGTPVQIIFDPRTLKTCHEGLLGAVSSIRTEGKNLECYVDLIDPDSQAKITRKFSPCQLAMRDVLVEVSYDDREIAKIQLDIYKKQEGLLSKAENSNEYVWFGLDVSDALWHVVYITADEIVQSDTYYEVLDAIENAYDTGYCVSIDRDVDLCKKIQYLITQSTSGTARTMQVKNGQDHRKNPRLGRRDEFIDRYRKESGLTLKEAANRVGLSETAYKALLDNKHPRHELFLRFFVGLKRLNIALSELDIPQDYEIPKNEFKRLIEKVWKCPTSDLIDVLGNTVKTKLLQDKDQKLFRHMVYLAVKHEANPQDIYRWPASDLGLPRDMIKEEKTLDRLLAGPTHPKWVFAIERFAESIGMNYSTIRRIFDPNASEYSKQRLRKLCEALIRSKTTVESFSEAKEIDVNEQVVMKLLRPLKGSFIDEDEQIEMFGCRLEVEDGNSFKVTKLHSNKLLVAMLRLALLKNKSLRILYSDKNKTVDLRYLANV